MADRTSFADSHRELPRGVRRGAVDGLQVTEVSVYLRPLRLAGEEAGLSRAQLARQRETDHAPGLARLRHFAQEHGLSIAASHAGRRLVMLRGTLDQFQAAFHTTLHIYEHEGRQFRGRGGTLSLPSDLIDDVAAVMGLDNRPQARTHFRTATTVDTSFLPNAVGDLYGFPDATGAGQTIGLIELGGGYTAADTKTAFAAMGLAAPAVTAVAVDGGKNDPGSTDGADPEVALDIQVAGGNAPGAALVVYFAPNTDAGFADAISQAVHDTTHAPQIVSISWGGPESTWTAQAVAAMNTALQDAATLNVSVFVACGDSLSTDGVDDGKVHVDFPAASPYAIACGGTRITVSDNAIKTETVWNDGSSGTGGGISLLAAVPAFQAAVKLPAEASTGASGRGVPDVAGNGSPETGYRITVSGASQVVGGTSAVAPLWAGLTARLNALRGAPVGFFLPVLYGASDVTRDVTTGDNFPSGSTLGYRAGPGWDACSGLGVPDGAGLGVLLGAAT